MKKQMSLTDGWRAAGFPLQGFSLEKAIQSAEWIDAPVPGDVHTMLMRLGRIGDPAMGTNDSKTAWVEKMVWVYKRDVSLPEDFSGADALRIVFQGLDTLCDVYWDGHKAASFANMFVEHTLDLTGAAVSGNHTLWVVFWPVCSFSGKEKLPEGFWINYSTERAFVRKAAYSFGWDWTPRVVTAGIWKPVILEAVYGGALHAVKGETLSLSPGGEEAVLRFSVEAEVMGGAEAILRITLFEGETQAAVWEGGQEFTAAFQNPRLWWTGDVGEPFLYTLRAELLVDGAVRDEITKPFGIRTLKLETESPEGERRFVIALNGRRIFSKGANWVPVSNRLGDISQDKTVYLLEMAAKAGMNTICVWGGGVYESDSFYNTCDRLGLLVWQYFTFACGEYPDFDEEFVNNVRDEAQKAVRRLSPHPSLALWIGNVEGQMLCEKIGLKREMFGRRLFEELIPSWLQKWDPERAYLPSSPWGGETANSPLEGDRHNWDVWFQDIPYEDYEKDATLFCSEFGVHAAPVKATVEKYTGAANLSPDSYPFRYMNRDQSLARMYYYFEKYTGLPRNLDEYIDYSMLIQKEALRVGSEHFSRRFPACGGALIWQLNDCCGAHSWSMIDVDGIPKASYYEAKRFFSPVAVSLKAVDHVKTQVWLHNHTLRDIKVVIHVEIGDFLGLRVYEESLEAAAKAGECVCVREIAAGGRFSPNVILHNRPRLFYIAARIGGQERPALRYFEEYKELPLPPADLSWEWEEDMLSVTSPVLARQVKVDGEVEGLIFSDNWFDLLPGETRKIRIGRLWDAPVSERKLYVKALNGEIIPLPVHM